MTPLIDSSEASTAGAGSLSRQTVPVLLWLGGAPALSEQLDALGAALDIEIVSVEAGPALGAALHSMHPIGLACGMEGAGATAACLAMKTVARYDQGLPMLLVTDEDPETLGCLDAIAALCALKELTRLTAPPRLEDLVAFLARAGRRSGRLALMPV